MAFTREGYLQKLQRGRIKQDNEQGKGSGERKISLAQVEEPQLKGPNKKYTERLHCESKQKTS